MNCSRARPTSPTGDGTTWTCLIEGGSWTSPHHGSALMLYLALLGLVCGTSVVCGLYHIACNSINDWNTPDEVFMDAEKPDEDALFKL